MSSSDSDDKLLQQVHEARKRYEDLVAQVRAKRRDKIGELEEQRRKFNEDTDQKIAKLKTILDDEPETKKLTRKKQKTPISNASTSKITETPASSKSLTKRRSKDPEWSSEKEKEKEREREKQRQRWRRSKRRQRIRDATYERRTGCKRPRLSQLKVVGIESESEEEYEESSKQSKRNDELVIDDTHTDDEPKLSTSRSKTMQQIEKPARVMQMEVLRVKEEPPEQEENVESPEPDKDKEKEDVTPPTVKLAIVVIKKLQLTPEQKGLFYVESEKKPALKAVVKQTEENQESSIQLSREGEIREAMQEEKPKKTTETKDQAQSDKAIQNEDKYL